MFREFINIRSVKESDSKAIQEIYAPYVLHTPVSLETKVPSLSEINRRILKIKNELPWLICEIDNEVAGYAYAVDHRSRTAYQWTKELSVYIDPKYRRKRLASALYTSVIDILKVQGALNVLAGITLPNSESVSFHENFGFKLIGIYHRVGYKLNKFHDTGWYEYVINNSDNAPLPIVQVSKLRNSGEWVKAIHHGLSLIK